MDLFVSPKEYFAEMVKEGLRQRQRPASPRIETYLVDLLEHFLDTRNLFDSEIDEQGRRKPQTLAEMYLIANQLEGPARADLLKELGDRTLYISGFFGESLERKIVDVDYYVDMGGAAYRDLSDCVADRTMATVYRAFSEKFIDYVDVLTYISQKSLIHSNSSLLRLYDRYLKTGSELAREKLVEMGVLTLPADQIKKARQF